MRAQQSVLSIVVVCEITRSQLREEVGIEWRTKHGG
jgi:hypothetical protein